MDAQVTCLWNENGGGGGVDGVGDDEDAKECEGRFLQKRWKQWYYLLKMWK